MKIEDEFIWDGLTVSVPVFIRVGARFQPSAELWDWIRETPGTKMENDRKSLNVFVTFKDEQDAVEFKLRFG